LVEAPPRRLLFGDVAHHYRAHRFSARDSGQPVSPSLLWPIGDRTKRQLAGHPATEILATGLDPCRPNPEQSSNPPGCTQESAVLVTLPPGAYTASDQTSCRGARSCAHFHIVSNGSANGCAIYLRVIHKTPSFWFRWDFNRCLPAQAISGSASQRAPQWSPHLDGPV